MDRIAPGLLCLIERFIRILEQLKFIIPFHIERSDTDADGNTPIKRHLRTLHRTADAFPDPSRNRKRRSRENDEELIAAPATAGIRSANRMGNGICHR